MTTSRTAETADTARAPTLGRLAGGSLLVALLTTVLAFVVTQLLLSFSEQVALGVVISLVVTAVGLAGGCYALGSRLGAPTVTHLVAGAAGGVLLGLGVLVSGQAPGVAVPVALAYVAVSVLGLRAGAAA